MNDDRWAIEDTITRLGRYIDDCNWPGFHEILVDPVSLDYTSLWGGQPEVQPVGVLVQGWAELVAKAWSATHHVITNVLPQIDGDTATAVANLVAVHRLIAPASSPFFTVHGSYLVHLVRGDRGWRIDHITLRTAWTEGEPGIPQDDLR